RVRGLLAAEIDAIGGPAHVAGLSWGGTVVLELYRRHPDLVATLILADTHAGGGDRCRRTRCAPASPASTRCSQRPPRRRAARPGGPHRQLGGPAGGGGHPSRLAPARRGRARRRRGRHAAS